MYSPFWFVVVVWFTTPVRLIVTPGIGVSPGSTLPLPFASLITRPEIVALTRMVSSKPTASISASLL